VTVSVAEIDRWRPGDVREVFHAAHSRADAAREAANGLATLPAFQDWGGLAADAARNSNEAIRRDLDTHGREALAVAEAADTAADEMESIQAELRKLREEAAAMDVEIDPVTNKIIPGPGIVAPGQYFLAVCSLQPELDNLVAEANLVDQQLANAINMADGDMPIPSVGPPVGDDGLTPTQIANDANQAKLNQEKIRTQADIDHLGNGPTRDAAIKRMAELNAISDGLSRADETYLAQLDVPDDYGKPVHAAIAVGNPDTATNVSVTVPGVSSTTKDSLPSMVSEANNLRRTALTQLRRLGIQGSVATIAWMGYDPPANPIDTGSAYDTWLTMTDDQAQPGATDLANCLKQVHATNPNAHLTLLGHSYGSLTSSLALQQLHSQGSHAVDDAVFYGSPGLELYSPSQLGLDGQAYVMRAPDDYITSYIAPLSPLHGWGFDPYNGWLPELSSQAGVSPDGILRGGAYTHADYPRAPNGTTLNMSGYNLATVVAGIPETPNGASQLVMADVEAMNHSFPLPFGGR
jgi:hypothetical protein